MQIADVKTSKTGKHGHMKVNITGNDVLTNKKYNDVMPGHATCVEFKYIKIEYQVRLAVCLPIGLVQHWLCAVGAV